MIGASACPPALGNYNARMSRMLAGNIVSAWAMAAEIKRKARELGFDLVGIASARSSDYRDYFRKWLEAGQAGSMGYLAGRFAERIDPKTYFPGAASVICVGINYYVPLEKPQPNGGRVARYAVGQDYHEILKGRLHALADGLREIEPSVQTRCSVDTAPVMEKELAARAGIGWMGKNTCVINERIGSWIFLGELLTTLALPADEPAADRCGSCRRCIEACPTQAITEPYRLDARKCISYLTIEHRGETEPELASKIGQWIYGCDICQEVCPWNRDPPAAMDPALAPRWAGGTLDPEEVLGWTEQDYQREFRGSAMKRIKLPMLKRNARLVQMQETQRPRDEVNFHRFVSLSLSVSSSLSRLCHSDPARLAFLSLVQRHHEDAVVQLRLNGLRIHSGRQREAALEMRVTPLAEKPIAFFASFGFAVFLVPGGNGQGLILDVDIDLILLEAGQLRLDVNVIRVFADVYAVGSQIIAAVSNTAAEKPSKHAVEFSLSLLERINTSLNSGGQ